MKQPRTAPPPPQAVLRQQWENLNAEREKHNLQPYSYTFLAEMADCAEIPGEATKVSKATVAAVMTGNYNTKTEPAIRRRLAQVIAVKWQDLVDCFDVAPLYPAASVLKRKPLSAKAASARAVKTIRCSNEGYITHIGRTYFAGSYFAGKLCTVASLRTKDKAVRITSAGVHRDAYPIDATTNQLGYNAKGVAQQ